MDVVQTFSDQKRRAELLAIVSRTFENDEERHAFTRQFAELHHLLEAETAKKMAA